MRIAKEKSWRERWSRRRRNDVGKVRKGGEGH